MPGVGSLLGLGCLIPLSRYQYITHLPSLSPITLPKKGRRSPPLLKTFRVCFKPAFKTSLWGTETKHIILQTPCPILPDILTSCHLLLVFFSPALVRKELQFSVRPEAGALGFVLPWCLPCTFRACRPPFTFPLFKTIWFSTAPDNLLQQRSLPRWWYRPGSAPPPSAAGFGFTATSCSPCLFAASLHLRGKNRCC